MADLRFGPSPMRGRSGPNRACGSMFRAAGTRASTAGWRRRSTATTGDREVDAKAPAGSDIDALGPWFQNLHLPDGRQTRPDHPLGDFPRCKWAEISPHLPADLTGWRVLDVGCNAGFFSFALAARGADVTAFDHNPFYLRQARWAAQRLDVAGRVRFEQAQVHDLARRDLGGVDLLVFTGVFYHLRYPLLALDTLASLKPRLMVFQTLTMGTEAIAAASGGDVDFAGKDALARPDWPQMAFIEYSFCADPTNWWVPNHAAVMALLRAAGFAVTARPGHEIYLCQLDAERPADPLALAEWRAAVGVR
jgi:tRNA (mo5U34)-methyltransferase